MYTLLIAPEFPLPPELQQLHAILLQQEPLLSVANDDIKALEHLDEKELDTINRQLHNHNVQLNLNEGIHHHSVYHNFSAVTCRMRSADSHFAANAKTIV
uniref:AlNc14C108G6288 protein n=1 Tax=Albugo laibachii Nc14 TaxID=890382 RepID=F0WI81_9STRA|nr:AlNc14C108G6288 [Albugo laibachii Nc14]|eukprot:CCA20960.1 AlNc14C108G6288 [Albugo laibachii Nc14]